MDILSYLLGKQSAGGGGGGGDAAETYPLTVSNEYVVCVLLDGDGAFYGNADMEISDTRITAAKGDTLYLLSNSGEPAGTVTVTFIDPTGLNETVTLLEIAVEDFTTTTIDGDSLTYAQITIPDTDLDGEPWGGIGFIDAFIPSGGGDDPIE